MHKATWQPISTAPKDGTKILISEGGELYAAWWDDKFNTTVFKNGGIKHRGAWTDGAVLSFGYEETKSYKPTHWTPLPQAPTP